MKIHFEVEEAEADKRGQKENDESARHEYLSCGNEAQAYIGSVRNNWCTLMEKKTHEGTHERKNGFIFAYII